MSPTMLLSKVERPTVIMITEKTDSPIKGLRMAISIKIPRAAENSSVIKKAGMKGI